LEIETLQNAPRRDAEKVGSTSETKRKRETKGNRYTKRVTEIEIVKVVLYLGAH
jgi:hypothetical protein